jgi:hypothetical protein
MERLWTACARVPRTYYQLKEREHTRTSCLSPVTFLVRSWGGQYESCEPGVPFLLLTAELPKWARHRSGLPCCHDGPTAHSLCWLDSMTSVGVNLLSSFPRWSGSQWIVAGKLSLWLGGNAAGRARTDGARQSQGSPRPAHPPLLRPVQNVLWTLQPALAKRKPERFHGRSCTPSPHHSGIVGQ